MGDRSWCAVLNEEGILLGRVRRGQLDDTPEAAAREVMEPGPSTYRPSLPVAELLESMQRGGFESAFVTDSDGRWIGLVAGADLEAALPK